MSIESSRLQNGLTVYTDHMPGAHTGLVHVHVGIGGLEGPKRDAGKAHALEHALHLGTDEFIDAEAAEHFVDAHGFTTNAYTTNVQTAYHAQGERLDPLMRYLSQVMLHPTFPVDAVAKEMSIIEEERLSSLTPETKHDMAASYALFGSSVARPIIGYRQPMFSADMLRDFWSRYYRVRAMAVVAVGAFSHEEVVESVEQYFDAPLGDTTDKKRRALNVRINTASSGLILPRGESAYLTESLPLSRELEEMFFSYDPAYRIAMDAMERWLSQEIREKRGLAYGSSLLLS
ncbi:MAG: pitrilysin family protein, partial [Candidatus Saccharimonas aalborgensis]